MSLRGRVRPGLVAEERHARDVDRQHDQRDQQRAAPGQLLPVVVGAHGELEDHHRQVGHRLAHVGAEELVVQRGEQQRRGLADDPGDRQQHAGDDAAAPRAASPSVLTFQRGAPSAKAASRRLPAPGAACSRWCAPPPAWRSATARANPPSRRSAGPCATAIAYTNRPSTIDGADSMMSVTKRVVAGELRGVAELGQIDAGQDADRGGHERREPTIIRLPTMALRQPPPSVPGAGVSG
jgi:hypothetical protein